jgi:Ca2+-binding RTX toxin-like protein
MATLSVSDIIVSEGDGFVDVVVTLSEASESAVSVNYATASSTATSTSGFDFTALANTLNFAAGETTQTVRVTLTNDASVEGFEHFLFNLSGATGATIADASAMIAIVDNDTVSENPLISVRDVTVDEAAGTASFVVMLGGPRGQASSATVTVDYTLSDAGAVAGEDYVALSDTLTFAPGETVKTVVVSLLDDDDAEGIERFALTLSDATNATIVDGTGVATIGANDASAVAAPRLSVADMIVSEADGYVDVVVALSAPGTNPVSVAYTTASSTATSTSGFDFTQVSGSLNFAPGETLKTVRVALTNDAGAEGFEHFLFNLSSAVNATLADASAMVSIVDNDTAEALPGLYVRDVVVDEQAGTASFVVMLGGPLGEASSGTVTVDYGHAEAGATEGEDYSAFGGTLVFAPGETVKTVVVDILDDDTAEGIERFLLDLNNAQNAVIVDGRGVATIGANEAPAVASPTLSVADMIVSEADGYVDLVVALSAPGTSAVSVAYATASSTATSTSGFDFTSVAGTLNFAPGETVKTVRVALTNDAVAETFQHFLFNLSGPTNATLADASAMVSIVDNDTASADPLLFVRDVVVDEQTGTASFVVMLGGPTGQASAEAVTVQYATADAGAVAGEDYTAASGSLVFAPGETVKTVVVDLSNDGTAEGIERFLLQLSSADNATIADGTGVATIAPNDAAAVATPAVSVADAVVSESDGYVDIVVSLATPANRAVAVSYTTASSTATGTSSFDFTHVSGTLNFAIGETVKTVRVALTDDAGAEGFEHFLLSLSSPVNLTIADGTASVFIADDDTVSPEPGIRVLDAVVDEKAGTATYVVALGLPGGQSSANTVTVDFATSDSTATAGEDFVATSGTLSFAPGETVKTIVVDLLDDGDSEGGERIDLELSNAGNAVIVDANGVAVLGASDATPVAVPSISVADLKVSEADGFVDVVVSLATPGTQAVAVNYATASSTATGTSSFDFTHVSGTLNFAIGETTKTVRISLSNDAGIESLEQFFLNLSSPVNAVIGDAQATVFIVDNDTAGVGVLSFGISDDVYPIDLDTDQIVENPDGGLDLADASVSYTLPEQVENLTLTGNADLSGTGNTLDNLITGNAGDNTLVGLEGNDTLNAAGGGDLMRGGPGDDVYDVNNGDDDVVELLGAGTDLVRSTISYTLIDNAENLLLQGGAGLNGTGNELANQITGNSGANRLVGDDAADTLSGAGGNDTLDGGAGADALAGGAGNDLYLVINAGDTTTEAADEGTDTVRASLAWTLAASLENLELTGTANLAGTGNGLGNLLSGNSGNNALSGAGGADDLRGNAGNDTLDGGLGADTLAGGAGNDTYLADSADTLSEVGGGGTDTVIADFTLTLGADFEHLQLSGAAGIGGTGNAAANRIEGNGGSNLLAGAAGADTLLGSAGDDTLDGGTGIDSLVGGTGDDRYLVTAGDIVVETDAGGTDTVVSAGAWTLGMGLEHLELTGASNAAGTGNTLANRIVGNDGNNELRGNAEADTLQGGAGNDTLNGGAGIDSLAGGSGDDTYLIDADDLLAEGSNAGIDLVQAGFSHTLGLNFENLLLTGAGAAGGSGNGAANRIEGNGAANALLGLGGNDTLLGGDGNDTLTGGAGVDSLDGGAGDDTYQIDSDDTWSEALGGGIDTVIAAFGLTLSDGFEHLVLTGAAAANAAGNGAANDLTGNAGANRLQGLDASDTLTGGDGNDTLDGGTGDDSIGGGTGNDSMIGGAGADTLAGGAGDDLYVTDGLDELTELANEGVDTVRAGGSFTLGATFENLVLSGPGNTTGFGNAQSNRITGTSGNNELYGDAGNDTVKGGAGADTLQGGADADTLQGGGGGDTYIVSADDRVVEAANAGLDTVISEVNWRLQDNVERLQLAGNADVNGTGNTLANLVTGNAGTNALSGLGGDDTLSGGAGKDVLAGGLGNDRLNGDAGNDIFVFDTALDAATNVDTVIGFVTGADKLRLDDDVFTVFTPGVLVPESAFVKGAGLSSAQDADDHLIYDTSSGRLYYDADGLGGADAILFAQLGTGSFPDLQRGDISVVV